MNDGSGPKPQHGVFEDVTAIHTLHIAPCYLSDLRKGIQMQLDRILLKYSSKLLGVPLCYSKMELVNSEGSASAPIVFENPCIHLRVKILWTLFSPRPGTRITGVINAISREHLGLLVYGYFSGIVYANHMEAVYSWDDTSQEWKNRTTNESLQLDQQVAFEIIELLHGGPVLTIIGSFDRLLQEPGSKPPRKRSHLREPQTLSLRNQ